MKKQRKSMRKDIKSHWPKIVSEIIFFTIFWQISNQQSQIISMSEISVAFIGDTNVGKTSIIDRLSGNGFEQDYRATIGQNVTTIVINSNNQDYKLILQDTAGQERFNSIIPMCINKSQIIVLVFSLIDRNTFQNLEKWANIAKEHCREQFVFVLVGNKSDLVEDEQISKDEIMTFAENNQIPKTFFTSAKTNENINELLKGFGELVDKINTPEMPNVIKIDDVQPKDNNNNNNNSCDC